MNFRVNEKNGPPQGVNLSASHDQRLALVTKNLCVVHFKVRTEDYLLLEQSFSPNSRRVTGTLDTQLEGTGCALCQLYHHFLSSIFRTTLRLADQIPPVNKRKRKDYLNRRYGKHLVREYPFASNLVKRGNSSFLQLSHGDNEVRKGEDYNGLLKLINFN